MRTTVDLALRMGPTYKARCAHRKWSYKQYPTQSIMAHRIATILVLIILATTALSQHNACQFKCIDTWKKCWNYPTSSGCDAKCRYECNDKFDDCIDLCLPQYDR